MATGGAIAARAPSAPGPCGRLQPTRSLQSTTSCLMLPCAAISTRSRQRYVPLCAQLSLLTGLRMMAIMGGGVGGQVLAKANPAADGPLLLAATNGSAHVVNRLGELHVYSLAAELACGSHRNGGGGGKSSWVHLQAPRAHTERHPWSVRRRKVTLTRLTRWWGRLRQAAQQDPNPCAPY